MNDIEIPIKPKSSRIVKISSTSIVYHGTEIRITDVLGIKFGSVTQASGIFKGSITLRSATTTLKIKFRKFGGYMKDTNYETVVYHAFSAVAPSLIQRIVDQLSRTNQQISIGRMQLDSRGITVNRFLRSPRFVPWSAPPHIRTISKDSFIGGQQLVSNVIDVSYWSPASAKLINIAQVTSYDENGSVLTSICNLMSALHT
jgi:hypothetical protein